MDGIDGEDKILRAAMGYEIEMREWEVTNTIICDHNYYLWSVVCDHFFDYRVWSNLWSKFVINFMIVSRDWKR